MVRYYIVPQSSKYVSFLFLLKGRLNQVLRLCTPSAVNSLIRFLWLQIDFHLFFRVVWLFDREVVTDLRHFLWQHILLLVGYWLLHFFRKELL